MRQLPATVNVQAAIEHDGLRAEITRGMRAPMVDGQLTLRPCWRADLFEAATDARGRRRWVALVTLVDDSPAGLFEQLSKLSTEGEVQVRD